MAISLIKVTAAIIEDGGRVLIAKRKMGDRHGGKWEFPGGKVNLGETPEDCLKRELKEELGIEAEIREFVCAATFKYMFMPIELLVFKARRISGEFHALDHDELRWVELSDLDKYDLVKADMNVVKKLIKSNCHAA